MNRVYLCLVAMTTVVALTLAGCSQAAPAPAPTQAPAKPAEPAKPAAAAPTAAPAAASAPTAALAKKVDFPQKGKAITLIVGVSAGGGTDAMARLFAPALEKELGVPVEVVNKTGAGGQIGTTELAKAKPDGYTVGLIILPTAIVMYQDPSRNAVFDRKSFIPLGVNAVDPSVLAVAAEGPYKTFKDFIDAAKARPGELKMGGTGFLGGDHLAVMKLEKAAGLKFSLVNFDGAAQRDPLILSGKIDGAMSGVGPQYAAWKAGTMRIFGVMDKQEHPQMPGVPPFAALGYPLIDFTSRGYYVPAGAPKEVVDVLSAAVKKVLTHPETTKKMLDIGVPLRYLPPDEADKYWADMEVEYKPLIEQALKEK